MRPRLKGESMRRHRYPQPSTRSPEQDQLPLDTVCTILIRQSTSIQRERNLFSAEVNPDDLMASALRFGFARERIEVVDTDMGIGAYGTRIEDRPDLHKWLYEDLPSGPEPCVNGEPGGPSVPRPR